MAYSESEKEKYLQYYQTERDAGRTPKKFGVWLKTKRKVRQAYDTLNTRATTSRLQDSLSDEEIARFRR
jgi:TfoX/Sxy family transcriptional regulator of competence genes